MAKTAVGSSAHDDVVMVGDEDDEEEDDTAGAQEGARVPVSSSCRKNDPTGDAVGGSWCVVTAPSSRVGAPVGTHGGKLFLLVLISMMDWSLTVF